MRRQGGSTTLPIDARSRLPVRSVEHSEIFFMCHISTFRSIKNYLGNRAFLEVEIFHARDSDFSSSLTNPQQSSAG